MGSHRVWLLDRNALGIWDLGSMVSSIDLGSQQFLWGFGGKRVFFFSLAEENFVR